jgi:hypothetical protein
MLEVVSDLLRFNLEERMGEKWVVTFVNRGKDWDTNLANILSEEKAELKSEVYEKIFLKSNPRNVVFLQRIVYHLSKLYFKMSVTKAE